MKTLIIERGGIGDLLFRIPYYHHLLDEDTALLCSKRDKEVLDFFLPGRKIYSYDMNWFLIDPFYRQRTMNKAGGTFDKLFVATPYRHEGALKVAEKIPAAQKYIYWEQNKLNPDTGAVADFNFAQGQTLIHYSETVRNAFIHGGFQLPENWKPYLFFRRWREKERLKTAEEKGATPRAILQPDAGVFGKRWPEDKWLSLAEHIEPSYSLSVVGQVALNLPGPVSKKGLSSGIVAAFREIARGDLFVGNDTGFTHLAYLSGIPTVFIAGGGEMGRFCPWKGYNATYGPTVEWVFSPMDCFGCGWACKFGDYRKITPPCIKNISLKDVLRALAKVPRED